MKRLMMSIATALIATTLLADADSRYGNLDSIECKRSVKGDIVEVKFSCGTIFDDWCKDLGDGSMKIFIDRPSKNRKRGKKVNEAGYYKMTMTAKKTGKTNKELVVGKFEIRREKRKGWVVVWTWTYTDEDKDHDLRRRDISLKPAFELIEITSKEEDD